MSTFGLAVPAGTPPQTRGHVRASAAPASPLTEGAGVIRRLSIVLALTSCAFTLWWARAADASTVSQARAEVHRLWGPQAPRMLCIIGRESGWNPRAINWNDRHRTGRGSFGLAQLGRDWITAWFEGDWNRALDPVVNVRAAYRVYRIQGYGAWTASRSC